MECLLTDAWKSNGDRGSARVAQAILQRPRAAGPSPLGVVRLDRRRFATRGAGDRRSSQRAWRTRSDGARRYFLPRDLLAGEALHGTPGRPGIRPSHCRIDVQPAGSPAAHFRAHRRHGGAQRAFGRAAGHPSRRPAAGTPDDEGPANRQRRSWRADPHPLARRAGGACRRPQRDVPEPGRIATQAPRGVRRADRGHRAASPCRPPEDRRPAGLRHRARAGHAAERRRRPARADRLGQARRRGDRPKRGGDPQRGRQDDADHPPTAGFRPHQHAPQAAGRSAQRGSADDRPARCDCRKAEGAAAIRAERGETPWPTSTPGKSNKC